MKKFFYIIAVFFVFVVSYSFSVADFYSSMTKVDYVEGSKTLKFTAKINAEHIAKALKMQTNTPNFKLEVERYVSKSFSIEVNGSVRNLTITGSQINGESVWVYFETSGVPEISKMKIKNAILLDVYPNQFNVVNIAYKNHQKTMNFQRGRDTSEVSF